MRRILLTVLAVIVIAGAFAGVGFAGYRYGYQQGAQAASDGEITILPFRRGNDFGWDRIPRHEFGWRMQPGFQWGPRDFSMMGRGGGFGIFWLFGLLIQLAILGFIVWLAYKLLTGWRLTRVTPESPRVEPAQPVEPRSTTDETSG